VRFVERLGVENHRGRRVPRVLGLAITLGGTLTLAIAGVGSQEWLRWSGCVLVGAAGLVDDLAPPGPRGLRGHLGALGAGRVTTGVLKVIVVAAAAIVVVASAPRAEVVDRVSSVVLIAGLTNVLNGLDVRPGRALKATLLVGAVLLAVAGTTIAAATATILPFALAFLAVDLRERAMLGDAGANLIGFALGIGVWNATPPGWTWLAAVVAVALNLVAETVTFSRVIRAVPPLRWLDELGRRPDPT
jgi:hypothetical protein